MAQKTPKQIIAQFKRHWKGTDEQLMGAVWDLMDDLLDSVNLARQNGSDEYATACDYADNHYSEI